MKHPLLILLPLLFLVMPSCMKEVEFNGQETDPKIVINCMATVGEPLTATLSKSFFFLTQEQDIDTSIPDSLKVMLFVNGLPMGEMHHTKDSLIPQEDYSSEILIQYFGSDFVPSIGDEIRIEATAPGFDKAVGTTSPLPNSVPFSIKGITLNNPSSVIIDQSWMGYYDIWFQEYATLTLEITDPNPGKSDYFMFNGCYDFPMEEVDVPNAYAQMRITTNDPVFGNETDDLTSSLLVFRPYRPYLFRDLLFDGSSYQIQIPIDFIIGLYDLADTAWLTSPKVTLPIEHLTTELYQYLNTFAIVEVGAELLTEPTQIHNNIQGGYGIVGGKHIDSVSLTLPLPDFSMINDTLL